jgi:hypothetical protein
LLAHQLAIHKDTKGLRAKTSEEQGQNMLNKDVMLVGIADSELIAINSRHKFVRPGEVSKKRQWAPFDHDLIVPHNAEATRNRIAVDLNPRWFLSRDIDGKVHAEIATPTILIFAI